VDRHRLLVLIATVGTVVPLLLPGGLVAAHRWMEGAARPPWAIVASPPGGHGRWAPYAC
jgi:hypothetical protein